MPPDNRIWITEQFHQDRKRCPVSLPERIGRVLGDEVIAQPSIDELRERVLKGLPGIADGKRPIACRPPLVEALAAEKAANNIPRSGEGEESRDSVVASLWRRITPGTATHPQPPIQTSGFNSPPFFAIGSGRATLRLGRYVTLSRWFLSRILRPCAKPLALKTIIPRLIARPYGGRYSWLPSISLPDRGSPTVNPPAQGMAGGAPPVGLPW
jgi:hypothetical protein